MRVYLCEFTVSPRLLKSFFPPYISAEFLTYQLQQPALGSIEALKLVKYWVRIKGSLSKFKQGPQHSVSMVLGTPAFRVGLLGPPFQSSGQRGFSGKGSASPCARVLSWTLSSRPTKPLGCPTETGSEQIAWGWQRPWP